MVELTLEENPSYRGVEARNSDIALMIIIWQRWYNVSTLEDGIVHLYRLYDLPREDNVKRIRAVIQNTEHRFMPTNPEILEKRGIAKEYWEEALGYKMTSQEIAQHRQNESLTKLPHFDDRQAKLLDIPAKPKPRQYL
jgi:hypothetical protein